MRGSLHSRWSVEMTFHSACIFVALIPHLAMRLPDMGHPAPDLCAATSGMRGFFAFGSE